MSGNDNEPARRRSPAPRTTRSPRDAGTCFPDADFPADPYPGAVPPCSYVHLDGTAHAIRPDPRAAGGWRVGAVDLDHWLAGHGADQAAARVPVLSYGSNRCPAKITWLRAALGLDGPVVVLRARTEGVAAVWAHGLRRRDGQRPAVLAAAPGVVEEHAVWLATPAQVAVLDRCEGRGDRFRLVRLHTGTVRTEDGALVVEPWCYLGHSAIRRPLLVDGRPVRCADVPQALALPLVGDAAAGDAAVGDAAVGDAATGDGLDAVPVRGAPHPDDWPPALFTYGLLQAGQPSWGLVAGHAAGPARRATASGAVFDTGLGYPALVTGSSGEARGQVVPLRDPASLFPALDAYEGPDYTRIRLVLPADGTVCWAYAWRGPTGGLTPLPAGWPG